MLHLPKKHPWLILVFIYVVIIAVWTTFLVLGKQQGKRMTPEQAEQHIRKHPTPADPTNPAAPTDR
ncbi:MAG: hypothetical protein ACPGUY_09030 [Akkermansiaceae bacterium]